MAEKTDNTTAVFKSKRPKHRKTRKESPPLHRPQVVLTPEDLTKIEKVIWGEARGESPEGRDAIRGVILNRLRSGRFGDTVDEVLTPKEFATIRDYGGSINDIPVPDEDLSKLLQESENYLAAGKDASGGRTFYQVESASGAYSGVDPMVVGNHTFYRGLEGQEPVRDISFSHRTQLNGMAEGGLMDDQMKFAFMAEGGMAADGMSHDPVSGNKIPPGSTAKEVRDDIPVNLSEGEYVIPADVVQYLGVAKLEALVEKAKDKLEDLDERGRIGGKPVGESEDDTEEEDDLPFSDEELLTEASDDDIVLGMAEGGLASQVAPAGMSWKVYTDGKGSERTILFYGDRPISPIPAGFYPKEQAPAVTTQTTPETTSVVKDGPSPTQEKDSTPAPPSDWSTSDIAGFAQQGKTVGAVSKAAGVVGPFGAVIGGLAKAAYNSTAQDVLSEIDGRLANPNTSEQDKAALGKAKSDIEATTSGNKGIFGNTGIFGKGGLFGKDGLFGSTSKSNDSANAGLFGLGSMFGSSKAPTPAGSMSAAPSQNDGGGHGMPSSVDPGPGQEPTGTGPRMAQGGLVKRRNKNC